MTLQQLIYFVEMAYTLHYTKTAKQLNIAQPSLSYALNKLSEKLGVPPLFKKSGKRFHLQSMARHFFHMQKVP